MVFSAPVLRHYPDRQRPPTDWDGRTNALMTEAVHRYFPWRRLESAGVHLGCYRPGDECGGGTKDHNLPAPPGA